MLGRHDDRWVDAPAIDVPSSVTEMCSDDEDGGALEAEEESGASTQRQMSEIESLEEHRVREIGAWEVVWCSIVMVVAGHHFL